MSFQPDTATENSGPVGLTTIRISKSALLHNLSEFRRFSPNIAAVVKNNAYGHGANEVCSILENEDVTFLIVDSLSEAFNLRKNKIQKNILTIGYTDLLEKEKFNLENISYTITSFEMLEDWANNAKQQTKIHLKIDTGMHRQGIVIERIDEAIQLLQKNPLLEIEGICTHLADADNLDTSYTDMQIKEWNKIVSLFQKTFPSLKHFHISNTAGHSKLSEAKSTFSRLGIGLYGLNGTGMIDDQVKLRPVLKMVTHITGTKILQANSKIGYNVTFTTPRETRVATLPIGYGFGYNRKLSNKGMVKIGDAFFNVVGRVSMNIISIDLGDRNNIATDSDVIVISDVVSDPNSILNISKICETIQYEICTSIDERIRRMIVE